MANCSGYSGNARKRDEFIASISEQQVLDLASSYLHSPRTFFRDPARGSYNICYFAQFGDGEKWVTMSVEQRTQLYTSLADIYIQLRRLEFPAIGCLTRDSDDGIRVGRVTMSIDINTQELDGLRPSSIQESYYDLGESTLLTDRLYHLHLFRQYAEQWTDCQLDHGLFVLDGDLEPQNLIVDAGENMSVLCLLDWEWSRMAWNFVHQDYLKHFNRLLIIIRERERELFGGSPISLADEWEQGKQDSGFLVANAVQN
ncbi:hypothetical protein B0T25DRAFT_585283 [Lasiosphaeria hispida]|uniref:Aminoglycoside phosphotransferase domain-containing protein n=1 Tax=Lasiosphaeria hispida TaxID=260671 RepID=A0AAJ0H9Y5_9PEZI|nr:hypothetical protein B0T25DRAFT_585283 [Lasiosphaeria hispida]